MAAVKKRLGTIEKEPILDKKFPHPYRAILAELRAIRKLLEAAAPPPPAPAVPPTVKVVPPPVKVEVPAITLPKGEFMKVYLEALEKYGALRFTDDLHVETVDLSVDRSAATNIQEFKTLAGVALTVFRTTGTFDLYLNQKDDKHKLTFDALTYPQTFLLDWFHVKTVYIGNSAQSGKEAKLIAWKRLS